MATRWCTMEDVQADLARATGGPRARTAILNEGCLLHGERPPPPHVADEQECEEEYQLRYEGTMGGASLVSGASLVGSCQPAPDLRGITSMIRMYENHGGAGVDSTQLTKSDEVIVISKPTTESSKREPIPRGEPTGSPSSRGLNPNAEDFVPTPARPRPSQPETSNDTVNIATGNRERGPDESITDEQRIEREELAAMLQNKIRASPADCPRLRRDRYAAIAGLLRLHSASPGPTPLATPAPAPTLRTPDYFRTHRAELSDTCANRDPELIETAETDTPAATPDHREVRDSISKVSAWLHSAPPAPTPPQPQLAPPSYRRRQDVAAAPPSPSRSPRIPPADVRYVPSANALAMSERYAARVASAPTPPPSLWDRVVDDLRAKDAKLARAEEGS